MLRRSPALLLVGLAACGLRDGCGGAPDQPAPEGPAVEQAASTTPAPRQRGRRGRDGKPRLGKWQPAADAPALTGEQQEVVAQLEAIGYADGTQAVAVTKTITVHDRARAFEGYNLYNSGHAAEAFLTDMDARVLHAWSARFADVFPGADLKEGAPGVNHWRRVVLGAGGTLYGIWEGRGLVKLDAAGKVLWARENHAHHHLALLDGGAKVAVLVREAGIEPRLDPDHPVLGDFVEILDAADGTLLRRVSVLDALLDGPYADVVLGKRRKGGDVLHTNSIQLLDGSVAARAPAFAAGDLLLSSRNTSAIGVLDLDTERFTWVHQGDFEKQHDPRITPSGRLLLFDNKGGPRQSSRVLAFDPATMQVTWSWGGPDADHPLRSPTLGTAQELPNGDVLVTESERGHAVEVAPDGSVVWEFWNPHRAGPQGEFIAALFEVVRLPPDTDLSWTGSGEGSVGGRPLVSPR